MGESLGNSVLENGKGNSRPGWAGGDVVSPWKGNEQHVYSSSFPWGLCYNRDSFLFLNILIFLSTCVFMSPSFFKTFHCVYSF